jgi:uncharacterized protein (TIGR03084 family)
MSEPEAKPEGDREIQASEGMREIVEALAEQHAELDGIISRLNEAQWATPTPACPGWTVADVVLHMAQTDEATSMSAAGLNNAPFASARGSDGPDVDVAAAAAVANQRGGSTGELYARWKKAADDSRDALAACDPSARVQWATGELAARTLATTRLAECWIHTGDVADPLGIERQPGARLWHIARLAWRTLPYAFKSAGKELAGPVALHLKAPNASNWDFDEGGAATTVSGSALEFCLIAGRRRAPEATAVTASGPDAEAVLALVRTYA